LEDFNPRDEQELRVLKNKNYGIVLKPKDEILKSLSVSVKKNSTEMKMHQIYGDSTTWLLFSLNKVCDNISEEMEMMVVQMVMTDHVYHCYTIVFPSDELIFDWDFMRNSMSSWLSADQLGFHDDLCIWDVEDAKDLVCTWNKIYNHLNMNVAALPKYHNIKRKPSPY
jgi:hypothetical protein